MSSDNAKNRMCSSNHSQKQLEAGHQQNCSKEEEHGLKALHCTYCSGREAIVGTLSLAATTAATPAPSHMGNQQPSSTSQFAATGGKVARKSGNEHNVKASCQLQKWQPAPTDVHAHDDEHQAQHSSGGNAVGQHLALVLNRGFEVLENKDKHKQVVHCRSCGAGREQKARRAEHSASLRCCAAALFDHLTRSAACTERTHRTADVNRHAGMFATSLHEVHLHALNQPCQPSWLLT